MEESRRRRADEGDEEWSPGLMLGSAHAVSDQSDEEEPKVAILVPDPEARAGWREFWVDPEPRPRKGPIGFRTKGG